MFLWWPSTKIVQAIMICQNTWLLEGGTYVLDISKSKTLKIFLSKTTELISIQLGRNVSLVTLYQVCSSCDDLSKNVAASGQGLFSLYIYIKHFKKSFCQKPLDRFQYNLVEMCPWWPCIKIQFKPSWCVKKNRATRGQYYKAYTKILEQWAWLKTSMVSRQICLLRWAV